MTRTSASAVLALIAVWLRSKQARRAGLLLIAVVAVVTAVSLSVAALTVTAAQQQARDFGRYQQSSYLSMNLGDLPAGTTARVRTALDRAAAGASVWVGSTTLRPDSYTKFFFLAPTTSLQYLEGPDLRRAYPGRYRLESGRWPTSPRDVLVSPHLQAVLPDKQAFTVLFGHARLWIVGTVIDRYTTDGDVILAGPGTWESLTPLPAARQYQPVEGQLHLVWNPPATASEVAAAVTPTLPKAVREAGASDAITGNMSRRTDPQSSDAADESGAVSPVPLLLIVLLVAMLAVATSRSANRATAITLATLGVRPWTVTRTQALAALITAAAAAVVGLALGWILTAAIRAAVLTRVATHPLAPPAPPGRDLVLIALAAVVVVTTGTLLPLRTTRSSAPRPASRRRALIGHVSRWLLAAAATAAGLLQPSPASPYLLLGGLLLLGPDLLHLFRASLPRTRPRTLVTRGLMRAAAGRQATAVIVIGACIAVPLLVAAQLASRQASDATYTFSTVPAGQIWVERFGDTADIRGVARAIRRIPGFPDPVPVRALSEPPKVDGSAGAQASFPRTATGGIGLLVIPDSGALHRLLGNTLPASAQATLDRGGVLDFLADHGPQRLATYTNGGQLQRTTAPLPTRHVTVGRAWRLQFSGAILAGTARTLELPLSAPVKYLYPDTTQTQIQQALATTIRAGYDSEFVHYTVPPPAPVLPVTALVFFAGLTFGGLAVLLLTTTDQTRRLRSYSSRLIAIGLTPAWTRSLLTLQTALITAAGLTTGVAAGLAALHLATRSYPVTVTPLLPGTVAAATTVLAALATTLVAARNVTAYDRRR